MGGATLREVMEDRGMTRYRLSKVSGIPWATLSDICTGRTELERCSAGTVLKLARALGLTVEETLDLETGEVSRGTDMSYPEADLPPDLVGAIEDVKEGFERGDPNMDLLLDSLYGSINANQWAGTITREQADLLRSRYYFGDEDDRLQRLPRGQVQGLRRGQRMEGVRRVRRAPVHAEVPSQIPSEVPQRRVLQRMRVGASGMHGVQVGRHDGPGDPARNIQTRGRQD